MIVSESELFGPVALQRIADMLAAIRAAERPTDPPLPPINFPDQVAQLLTIALSDLPTETRIQAVQVADGAFCGQAMNELVERVTHRCPLNRLEEALDGRLEVQDPVLLARFILFVASRLDKRTATLVGLAAHLVLSEMHGLSAALREAQTAVDNGDAQLQEAWEEGRLAADALRSELAVAHDLLASDLTRLPFAEIQRRLGSPDPLVARLTALAVTSPQARARFEHRPGIWDAAVAIAARAATTAEAKTMVASTTE